MADWTLRIDQFRLGIFIDELVKQLLGHIVNPKHVRQTAAVLVTRHVDHGYKPL
jgi:hypothetical protein